MFTNIDTESRERPKNFQHEALLIKQHRRNRYGDWECPYCGSWNGDFFVHEYRATVKHGGTVPLLHLYASLG